MYYINRSLAVKIFTLIIIFNCAILHAQNKLRILYITLPGQQLDISNGKSNLDDHPNSGSQLVVKGIEKRLVTQDLLEILAKYYQKPIVDSLIKNLVDELSVYFYNMQRPLIKVNINKKNANDETLVLEMIFMPDFIPERFFNVPEGYEVKLWAKSPMLKKPTNIDIDIKGRVWVTEGINHGRRYDTQKAGDSKRDGKESKSHYSNLSTKFDKQ